MTPHGAAGAVHRSIETARAQMRSVFGRTSALDLRRFEASGAARLRSDLVPEIQDILEQTDATLAGLLGALDDHGLSLPAVDDVASLARLEIRHRTERVRDTVRLGVHAALLHECDGAVRRVRRGLGATDRVFCIATGSPAVLRHDSELEDSLRVRGAYAKLRARLLSEPDATAVTVFQRLRAVGTQIAILIGWDAYPLLRCGDRLQLRALQGRILAWLRPESRGDTEAGLRLWRDVVSFAEMLAHINRRQELVEHDSRLLAELLARLSSGPLPRSDRERLRQLVGLDRGLDAAIWAEVHDQALWGELSRVSVSLGLLGARS